MTANLEKEVAMNRLQWNACSAPDELLCPASRTADDRRLRLFACALCRLIWRFLPKPARMAPTSQANSTMARSSCYGWRKRFVRVPPTDGP